MIHLTRISKNKKTGPIPVSTSSATTCPSVCPFKKQGCYAKYGPLAMHWKKITEEKRGVSLEAFFNELRGLPRGILFRHNQAGDLDGTGNTINPNTLKALVKSCKRIKGFTYTHKPVLPAKGVRKDVIESNRVAIKHANENGFTINLSSNNLEQVDALIELGIAPVVTVLSSDTKRNCVTPNGNKVVVCPATKSNRMTCANCGLCQKVDRKFAIGFPAHGTGKKKIDATQTK